MERDPRREFVLDRSVDVPSLSDDVVCDLTRNAIVDAGLTGLPRNIGDVTAAELEAASALLAIMAERATTADLEDAPGLVRAAALTELAAANRSAGPSDVAARSYEDARAQVASVPGLSSGACPLLRG